MVSGANQHYSPSNCAGRTNLDTSAAAPLRVCLIATHFAEYGYALAQSLARSADVLVVASEENTKRTGQRCKLPSMLSGNVCRAHGGAAPQTRAKAQRRLQPAADVLVQRLLSFALDGNAPDAVALQAIHDALDRAGLKPGVEVGMTVKPYESILEQIESGSRAEFRRSRGVADDTEHPPALADTPRELTTADADAPIDTEIVDDGTELIAAMRRSGRVTDDGQPITPDETEHGSAQRTAAGIDPLRGIMTLEEAVALQAQVRRAQRALPRGSS